METSLFDTPTVGIKPEAAARRIASFERRFGKPHLDFVCHAAFPMTLTPELMYRLWANFQKDIYGQVLNIPRIAVTDLLLSTLCQEVGHELYEMDIAIRNQLLSRLKEQKNFGQKRIKELSGFLIGYFHQQLHSDDPDIQDLAEAQCLTALVYTEPSKAAHELALLFAKLNHQDTAELVRMATLVETVAEPLSEKFTPLLIYARSMAAFARSDLEGATALLGAVVGPGKQIRIAGVKLPIPEQIKESLRSPEETDYRGKNLRGHSFKGQNLTRADFSHADIRGADFTNTNLTGANFSQAIAGRQRRWIPATIICSLLLFISSAVVSLLIWFLIASVLDPTLSGFTDAISYTIYYFWASTSLMVFAVAYVFIIRYGIEATIGAVALALWGIFCLLFLPFMAVPVSGDFPMLGILFGWCSASAGILILIAAVSGAQAGDWDWAGAWLETWVLGAALILFVVAFAASSFAFSGEFVVGTGILVVVVATGFVGAVLTQAVTVTVADSVGAAWAVVVGWALPLGTYLGLRALAGEGKYAFVQRAAAVLGTMGGTSFRGANLTDANFTQARLKSANFTKANLTRTCWFQSKQFRHALVGPSYLKHPKVQKLVITGWGQGKNFDGLCLRGINLCQANLEGASFIGTDLREANLQDADLSGAKLVRTQLDQTDLTGACLTGACIQDWNITDATQLEEVECDYIYRRMPTRENPDPCRQPEAPYEIFEPGAFCDFIRSG